MLEGGIEFSCFGQVMCEHLWLFLNHGLLIPAHDVGNASVHLLSMLPEHSCVGGVSYQRMFEGVEGFRRHAPSQHQT